jgi:hypothetical protein
LKSTAGRKKKLFDPRQKLRARAYDPTTAIVTRDDDDDDEEEEEMTGGDKKKNKRRGISAKRKRVEPACVSSSKYRKRAST